jgi:hypothetical protein
MFRVSTGIIFATPLAKALQIDVVARNISTTTTTASVLL